MPWAVPMGPRDTAEEHRVSTPLELFFDLVLVVAVASSASSLHHGLATGHLAAFVYFPLVFAAVWWAWVNYTWFASAYDSGDLLFRLLSFVIMTGSLMLAAAVPDLFADGQSVLAVAGYAVMRLGMVALWLRAARGHPEGRRTALTYAVGITLVQVFWVARLVLDGHAVLLVTFGVGMFLEFSVPYVAERRRRTPYHPGHIAERYGLFTIIVLGEVVLSSVVAVQGALGGGDHAGDLMLLVVGGLLLVFSLWWTYFKRDHAPLFASERIVFRAAYGHFFVFAAVAATGAGLAAAVDVVTGEAHTTTTFVAWGLAVPVAVYLLALGVTFTLDDRSTPIALPALLTAAGVLGVTAVGLALGAPMGVVVLLVGLVCAVAVVPHVVGGSPAAT